MFLSISKKLGDLTFGITLVINTDAENIILILMNTRYMNGRWYTWDLHIVAIDI